MKILHLFWILFLFQTNVCFAQYSKMTMEDIYKTYYTDYSSQELDKVKDWYKTYLSYYKIKPHELAIILEITGPELYKIGQGELIDILLKDYSKDVKREGLKMIDAMKVVWNTKDIPKGRWPVDQAWDYSTHIDCDFSPGTYTRLGWGVNEEQLYQRIMRHKPQEGPSVFAFDTIKEDILKTIEKSWLQIEFLILYAKKVALEKHNYRCIYILRDIAKKIHENDKVVWYKKSTYFLTIAKISTEIFNNTSGSAEYLASARQYVSKYGDESQAHQLYNYLILKSFFHYEQQGFKGCQLALVDNHMNLNFLEAINTPQSRQHLDGIRDYPYAWHYSEAFHRLAEGWYDFQRHPGRFKFPFAASAIHLVLAKKTNPKTNNRLLMNNLAIMLADYQNNFKTKEKLLLESAALVEKHPKTYAVSDKYRLFVSLLRHNADLQNQPVFGYLQTVDKTISTKRDVELFTFSPFIFKSPFRLNTEEAEGKFSEIKTKYENLGGMYTRYLLDPLHDYVKAQSIDRLLEETIELELKSMTKRLSGLSFDLMNIDKNNKFEGYNVGLAKAEGMAAPDKILLNMEIEDLQEVVSESTEETRQTNIALVKSDKKLAITSEELNMLKKKEIELLKNIGLLEIRKNDLTKNFELLGMSYKDLENDYGTLEEQKAKTDRNLAIAITVGIIAFALALLAFRLQSKASKAKSRAQASEIREKASAFALSQIGHLAPECIHQVRMEVDEDSLEYKLLGRLAHFLEKVYGIYTRKRTTLEEESYLINQFVSLKYTPLATKNEESSHMKINYRVVDLINPKNPAPMFALLNVVVNSFEHGDIFEIDRYEHSIGMVDVVLAKEGKNIRVTVTNYKKKNRMKPQNDKHSTGLIFLKALLASWNGDSKLSKNPAVWETNEKYTISYEYKYREAAV